MYLDYYQSYLTMIRNSVGLGLRKHLYISKDDGSSKDILHDGNLSCTYFVSCILKTFNLSPVNSVNVLSFEKVLLEYGWQSIDPSAHPDQIIPGSIIIRSQKEGTDKQDIYGNTRSGHHHIGFYVGDGHAISNMSESFGVEGVEPRTPQQHHYTYNEKRPIKSILTFNFHMTMREYFTQANPTMLFNKQLEIPFIWLDHERFKKADQLPASTLEPKDIAAFKELIADCVDNKEILLISQPKNTWFIIKWYNRNGQAEELIVNDPSDPKATEGFPWAPISLSLIAVFEQRDGKYYVIPE